MRSIPPDFLPPFFAELFFCSLYAVFLLVMMRSKEHLFRTPFFKLVYASGFAGIEMIAAHWVITLFMKTANQGEADAVIYVSQVWDGSATVSNTISKFFLVINRFSVLESFKSSIHNKWSNRTIRLIIFGLFTFPLLPHLYFVTRPLNFINGSFDALDFETGSMYRSVTGAFYATYAALASIIAFMSMEKLQRLWSDNNIYSVALYKQQRSLTTYTLLITGLHILFAIHQFVWTYAYLDANRPVLVVIRAVRPYVFDVTTFVDPVILFVLSKQVRTAFYNRIFGNRPLTNIYHTNTVNPI